MDFKDLCNEQKLRDEKDLKDREKKAQMDKKEREDIALLKITNRIDQELQNGNATVTMNAGIIPSGTFARIEHKLRERYCGSYNL